MSAIFISHSSADTTAATEMKAWLEGEGHTSLFLDFDPDAGILSGASWEQTLYQQLRQCQAVIALITPNWLASKWCFAELVQAREKGKAIFPVTVQPCDRRGFLDDIQHIDLTAEREKGYRQLAKGLKAQGIDPRDEFDWDPTRSPYPGLSAFQEADAAIFFGRGEDSLKILETLDGLRRQGRAAARFGLMLGASGSGKSSLLRAGVLPRLKKRPAEWLPLPPFRPQVEPLDELAKALALAFAGYQQPRDWRAIQVTLGAAAARKPSDGSALVELMLDLTMAAQQPDATVLLSIDQAEELFGYSPPEAATRFLRLLRGALEWTDPRLLVVATIRSDCLGEFQNHPTLQDAEYGHHFDYQAMPVAPMPLRNFPTIVQGPARLAGLQLEEGLVEELVRETGTRDALPLLAFTLRRLYGAYGGDGQLRLAEYRALGGLEGSIRDAAQRILDDAKPTSEELDALRAAFVPTMVRINADGDYGRRRALLATMPPAAIPLLERFVEARLLVTDRDPQGETVEVAHEALLRTWPQLQGWLDDDQSRLRLLEGIQRAAEEWGQSGQRDDLLIHRASRLEDAEALLANPRFKILETSPEWAYMVACRSAQHARDAFEREERERRIRDAERIAEEQRNAAEAHKRVARRTRVGLAAVAVLAILAVGALLVARNAQQQTENRLATQLNGLEGELVLSALAVLSPEGDEPQVLNRISDSNLTSNQWVASVGVALGKEELVAGRRAWVQKVRTGLAARLSATRRIDPAPSRQSDEQLNARIRLAGGSFVMGSRDAFSQPQHRVRLSPFWIQEHEVTNAEYRRFLSQTKRDPNHDYGAASDLPAVDVSWEEAMAYAAWLGGNLPTEAQWELAARGMNARVYPWGVEEPTAACDRANFDACQPKAVRPVKAGRERGKTPEGVYDLAGNVQEWCRDWYGDYVAGEQTDPLGPATGLYRTVRGGAFAMSGMYLRGAYRTLSIYPSGHADVAGFRVVWSAEPGPE